MTTVITWRLTHREPKVYTRFILIESTLFRLVSNERGDLAPLGYSYVSVEDAHLDAVAETAELELRGYWMHLGDMRWTRISDSTDVDLLLMWVWDEPDKALAELHDIVLAAIMTGEVLA